MIANTGIGSFGGFGGYIPTIGGRPAYSPITNQLTDQQIGALGGVANQGCALISNPAYRALCLAGVSLGTTIFGGSGGSAGSGTGTGGGSGTLTGTACPEGYVPDGAGGCRIAGLGSYLPGDIGAQDTGWTPVAGLYGVGVTPIAVQSVKRACPAGFVLGKDGFCYEHLGRTQRAHNPGARPMLTGGDVNALRRAKSLQKRIGKLTTAYGKKPCRCAGKKKTCK